MPIIQDVIHKLEVAGGMRYLRVGLAVLAVAGAATYYNFRCFKNMSNQEAMDSAQLGRNISQGKGYTTYFIRPFSMYLLRRHNEPSPKPLLKCADCGKVFEGRSSASCPKCGSNKLAPEAMRLKDLTGIDFEIKGHPDIANPPVYPIVLAGLMKILPFRFIIPEKAQPFWSNGGYFYRDQPDFLISAFNQLLFFSLIVVVFFLARRLFDKPTAWLSAVLLFGTDIFWRFSVSGLSTISLLLIFSGLIWCLLLLEEGARELNRGLVSSIVLALFAGILLGVGGLTRYSFAWLFIPTILYLFFFGGPRRFIITPVAFVAFLVVILPWIIRNYHVSGTPFGTAGYAIYDGTAMFPENHLDRSLQPDFAPPPGGGWLTFFTQKLLLNLRHVVQNDFLRLGGGFVSAFFLVGLLVVVSNPGAARLRYFVIGSLVLLIVVQALGRTHLSDDSPDINTENLLVLLAPFVIVFGCHFFWLLLNQIYLPIRELRYVVIGAFCLIACLPMLFNFLPPKTSPIVYPPYLPTFIQRAAGFVKEDDLTMSDIPWAMAWYGKVPSIWATETSESFVEIDSLQKPIKELYLTTLTLNGHFLTQWTQSPDAWGYLFMQLWGNASGETLWPRELNLTVNHHNDKANFPLHYFQAGWPRECLLTSRPKPATVADSK